MGVVNSLKRNKRKEKEGKSRDPCLIDKTTSKVSNLPPRSSSIQRDRYNIPPPPPFPLIQFNLYSSTPDFVQIMAAIRHK